MEGENDDVSVALEWLYAEVDRLRKQCESFRFEIRDLESEMDELEKELVRR